MQRLIIFSISFAIAYSAGIPYNFGFINGDVGHHSRSESGAPDGSVTGTYSYIDPNGYRREVRYIADKFGYRPQGDISVDRVTAEQAARIALLAPQPVVDDVQEVQKSERQEQEYDTEQKVVPSRLPQPQTTNTGSWQPSYHIQAPAVTQWSHLGHVQPYIGHGHFAGHQHAAPWWSQPYNAPAHYNNAYYVPGSSGYVVQAPNYITWDSRLKRK